MSKGLTPEDIIRRIQDHIGKNGLVRGSEYNMSKWIVHVRLHHTREMMQRIDRETSPELIRSMEKSIVSRIHNCLLDDVIIAGIPDIKKATPVRHSYSTFDADGNHVEKEEWMLEVEGSSFLRLLGHPGGACLLKDLNLQRSSRGCSRTRNRSVGNRSVSRDEECYILR